MRATLVCGGLLFLLAGCASRHDPQKSPDALLRQMASLVERKAVSDRAAVEQALNVRISQGVSFGTGWTRARIIGWLETPGAIGDYAYQVRSIDTTPGRAPGFALEEAGLSLHLGHGPCVRPYHVRRAFGGPNWSLKTDTVRLSDGPPDWRPFPIMVAQEQNRSTVSVSFSKGLDNCAVSARLVQNWVGQ